MQNSESRNQEVRAAASNVLGEMVRRYPVNSERFETLTALVGKRNDQLVLVNRKLLSSKAEALRIRVEESAVSTPEQIDAVQARLDKYLPGLKTLFARQPSLTSIDRLMTLDVVSVEMRKVFQAVSSRIIFLETTPAGRRKNKFLITTLKAGEMNETLKDAANDGSDAFKYSALSKEAADLVREQAYEWINTWALRDREHLHTLLDYAAAAGERALPEIEILIAKEQTLADRMEDLALVQAASDACDEAWLDRASTVSDQEIVQVLRLDLRGFENAGTYLAITD